MTDRYWLCGDYCTTDCGACKGAGRPMAAPAERVTALLDQLDELRAAATPGPWAQHPSDPAYVLGEVSEGEEGLEYLDVADCGGRGPWYPRSPEPDAALIVAAVNALPELLRLARERYALERALLDLADELDGEAAERDRIAERLPNTPSYHMEINRLSVAANHQARAARQLRTAITTALAGQHTTDEEADRG